uniref:Mediator of RNA polymerase II transcription subunit 8 n=1 Tax=Chlamydomonas leiostraca TaxID=1034604 RepID=A0A7S0RF24_9CHLO|mmetsp:Transcript_21238/g.54002  ORF Transcript_21238/g.54002 Transcript_21238/m.54002 type:complete len:249 (+) Transcript_21238:122-868(+)|eukprot:CAMPEP_0202859520 /NCGR_PEP_ID=MMETSP1391-20130828/1594_1 /ASSEMBLY_ACC=CAM_ASM_000867 /TAXON_ID=1034604 /ORGANISM="Chlamydomonas leiostraca, Strain SAG 11-49" /LENGTH=248 /DNA_ID=CAMNT_0049538555 /DNA_START=120 /DNA_END=866 /DNA_ORIENTATION=-
MQQPTTAVDARAQGIMGAGSGQFNLAAARARAQELRASITEVINALITNAHELNWEAVLKKFTTINIQIMALREQLRGVLRTVVVHPRLVDDPRFAQALPIQLASAVLPEMEAGDSALVAREAGHLDARGVPPSSRYEVADSAIEDFNRLVSDLTGPGGMLWGETSNKAQGTGARQDMAARSKVIAKSIAAARQAQQHVALLRAGSGPGAAAAAGAPAAKRARGNESSQGGQDPALVVLLSGPIPKQH